MAKVYPSGEQIAITLGDQHAIVVEVGGGLREYSAAGRDILDGYGVDAMCPSGRGQVLMPWPNRVEDGSYEFEGERQSIKAATNRRHRGAVRRCEAKVRLPVPYPLHEQPNGGHAGQIGGRDLL